jgi:hypothetical protein
MYPNMMYHAIDHRYLSQDRIHERVLPVLQNCEAVCEYSINTILQREDPSTRREQLKLLNDCADICTLTVKYIARNSRYAKSLALLCAQICEDCGNHCLQHPDSLSQLCGQLCLKCAQELRVYAR